MRLAHSLVLRLSSQDKRELDALVKELAQDPNITAITRYKLNRGHLIRVFIALGMALANLPNEE